MSKTNKEICKKYMNLNEGNILFNEVIDDNNYNHATFDYNNVKYKVPKISEFLLDFYLENEKFDIEEEYLNVDFKIKYDGEFTYVFMKQYVIEKEIIVTRLKIFIE